jgi:cellulose synthase/poly-beta-1,6-N-acetylglucosamine synthase-like glycosyltransferase
MLSWPIFLWLISLSLISSVITFLFSLLPCRFRTSKYFIPSISVIIPSRNEEGMIADVLDAWLAVNYPKEKVEILCVDNSKDRTPEILKGYARKIRRVRFMRGNTKSKLGAVLFALKRARNPVVLISDSDVLVSPSSVRECVKYLSDDRVGAVFGKRTPVNYKTGLFSRWDALRLLKTFVGHIFFTRIDSSIYFSASPVAMRKKDLADIKETDELIADDLYVALHIRKKGLKVVFNPDVEGKVGVLNSIREVFIRNPRSAKGTAQLALRGYAGTLFNRKYGRFGMFTIPYVEFFYISGVLLYTVMFFALIADLLISGLSGTLLAFSSYFLNLLIVWYLVMFFGTFLFTLIVLFVIRHRDWTFLAVILLDPFVAFVNMIAGFIGFYSYVFGRKVEWKKTTSDRNIK